MRRSEDKIKDLFSSKLQNFERDVPPSIWERIDSSLPSTPIEKRNKRILLRSLVAVACTMLVLILSYFLLPDQQNSDQIFVSSQQNKNGLGNNMVDSSTLMAHDARIKINMDDIGMAIPPPVNRLMFIHIDPPFEAPFKDGREDEDCSDKESIDVVPNRNTNLEVSEETEADKTKDKWAGEFLYSSSDLSNRLAVNTKMEQGRDDKIGLSFISNAGLLSSNMSQRGGVMTFSKEGVKSILNAADTPETNNAVLSYNQNNNYDLDHKQPVTFGLTISKNITTQLSVETGLTYTYLSSTIKAKGEQTNTDEKQIFHYLGIPINLNYTFMELGKAKFYLSVGGAIQKDVNGEYRGSLSRLKIPFDKDISSDSKVDQKLNMSISQSHLQFSTRLNVGASYPIYKDLYIYGSFGGAYYFDAKNEYRTIYSDKNTQLDLNMGLKWEF